MIIKWKKNNKLKPDIILQKLTIIKSISADGKVTIFRNSFDFDFALSALETMIAFPKETNGNLRKHLLLQAVYSPEELNKDNICSGSRLKMVGLAISANLGSN